MQHWFFSLLQLVFFLCGLKGERDSELVMPADGMDRHASQLTTPADSVLRRTYTTAMSDWSVALVIRSSSRFIEDRNVDF